MMTSARVCDNLDSIQTHLNVGTVWGKQFLTSLCTKDSIMSLDDTVSNLDFALARDLCNHPGEDIVFVVTLSLPGRKVTHLAVVAIVGEPELGTDHEDLFVETDDSAVVTDVAVHDWPGMVL